jgi:hypothetical protein
MQCYEAYYHPTNCGCGECISSTNVLYIGPNLPNSGVNTNDSITVALEKIDNKLSAESILEAIAANPTLTAQLCAIINQC